MKVLLTGAFGNVGAHVLDELLTKNHEITAFDIKSPATERVAAIYKGKINIFWGNITKKEDTDKIVQNMDIVLHLGAIPAPRSENMPELAKSVNVDGTRNVIESIKKQPSPARLVFSSSVTVFGKSTERPPRLRTVIDPIIGSDHYTEHKVACEEMIRESGLQWCILRFGAAPAIDPFKSQLGGPDEAFKMSLDSPVEFVDVRDVALAVANTVDHPDVWGKILLIGGGKRNQMTYREFYTKILDSAGVGMFPDRAFTKEKYYTHWMDTTESQQLLQYQNHTFDDFMSDQKKAIGYRRYLATAFRPFVRMALLRKSPWYTGQSQ